MARVDDILTAEKADLLAYYKADPMFLRLLELAGETATTFDTFINT
jgi:hypothetical protein